MDGSSRNDLNRLAPASNEWILDSTQIIVPQPSETSVERIARTELFHSSRFRQNSRLPTRRPPLFLFIRPQIIPFNDELTFGMVDEGLKFTTLDEALTFWGIAAQPRIELEGEDLDNVRAFLGRLTKTAEYENANSRPVLTQRVQEAFQLIATDDEVKGIALTIISNGLTSCRDRIISALDQLELTVLIQKAGDSEEKLRLLGQSMLRLEMVNAKAKQHINSHPGVDEIEVLLAFQIGLAGRLELPVSTRNMLFRSLADITEAQIQEAGDAVLRECTQERIDEYLANWDPWIRHQRRLTVTSTSYDMLPLAQRQQERAQEGCVILGFSSDKPVLYDNQVYDYDAFAKEYIRTGINPISRAQLDWSQLRRLK